MLTIARSLLCLLGAPRTARDITLRPSMCTLAQPCSKKGVGSTNRYAIAADQGGKAPDAGGVASTVAGVVLEERRGGGEDCEVGEDRR